MVIWQTNKIAFIQDLLLMDYKPLQTVVYKLNNGFKDKRKNYET